MGWIGEVPFKELGMTQERLDLLEELAEGSDYWRNASSFLHQVRDRKPSSLSDRQGNWIQEIVAALGNELNKRTAREVFEG